MAAVLASEVASFTASQVLKALTLRAGESEKNQFVARMLPALKLRTQPTSTVLLPTPILLWPNLCAHSLSVAVATTLPSTLTPWVKSKTSISLLPGVRLAPTKFRLSAVSLPLSPMTLKVSTSTMSTMMMMILTLLVLNCNSYQLETALTRLPLNKAPGGASAQTRNHPSLLRGWFL